MSALPSPFTSPAATLMSPENDGPNAKKLCNSWAVLPSNTLTCELPPDVELVKVDGPTQHLFESGMLIFKPAAELAAREALVFKVTVKSTVAGTLKLRARLTSESIQKPLIVEEATQFYAE